jgi:hypothetical protein
VFFNEKVKSHAKYCDLCPGAGKLTAALKLLTGEFAIHLLYARRLAGEADRDDE